MGNSVIVIKTKIMNYLLFRLHKNFGGMGRSEELLHKYLDF